MSAPASRGRCATRIAAIAVTLLSVTAACSTEGPVTAAPNGGQTTAAAEPSYDPEGTRPRPTIRRTSYPLGPHWPLTGFPLKGRAPQRPVFVVKVDNTANAYPQLGVRSADLVVEELVEGGLTRLAAFYYSDIPRVVGPVRSMRTSDVAIVKPTNGTLVASGGAPKALRAFDRAEVRTLLDGAPGFFRSGSRPSPYDLMLRLRALVAQARRVPPPPDYLPWTEPDDDQQVRSQRVRRLRAGFSPAHTTEFRWARGRGWIRINGPDRPENRFVAGTIVVLRVAIRDAGYLDPAGSVVPETDLAGHGDAMVLHGPTLVRARWQKPQNGDPLRLTTRSGRAMSVPPGNTWVELVPNGGSVRVGR